MSRGWSWRGGLRAVTVSWCALLLAASSWAGEVPTGYVTSAERGRVAEILMTRGMHRRDPGCGSPRPGPGYLGPYFDVYTMRVEVGDEDLDVVLRRMVADDWWRTVLVAARAETPGDTTCVVNHGVRETVTVRRRGRGRAALDERDPLWTAALRALQAEHDVDARRLASIRERDGASRQARERELHRADRYQHMQMLKDLKRLPVSRSGRYGAGQ